MNTLDIVILLLFIPGIIRGITKAVEMASLGWLNRALGFIFSILVTALVLGLIAIVFDTLNVKFELVKTSILQDSVLYGHLKDFGYFVFPYMKQLLSLAS